MNPNINVGEQEPPKKKKKPDLPIVQIKNAADYQRMKLDRLMANPDKPIVIPGPGRNKNLAPPPDFVRNIMGSSAGAGSGEFHVYRHLRRKEYARQKQITEQAILEQKDIDFQNRIEANKQLADAKTAKKRAKRLKKKAGKRKGNNAKAGNKPAVETSSASESDDEDEDDNKKSDEVPASVTGEKIPTVSPQKSDSTDEIPTVPTEEVLKSGLAVNPRVPSE